MLELAKLIAYKAHMGQYRKNGLPYFMHLFRVSEKCTDTNHKIVALLHDVLEDTGETRQSLLDQGIPENLVNAISILNKSKYNSYDEYIRKIKSCSIAKEVKILDILDNLCDNPTRSQIIKYSEALLILLK